jgi:4-alpha-glucanotransferase
MPNAHAALQHRAAGILLHLTSLPGGHGTGDLGPQARRFIDRLSRAGIRWWQTLPVHPTVSHACPYSADSSHAGNPLLLSLNDLKRDGLLKKSDLPDGPFPEGRLHHDATLQRKRNAIALAWEHFQSGRFPHLHDDFARFRSQQSTWLEEYALFATLRRHIVVHHWQDWPRPLAHRHPEAMESARRTYHADIELECFTQFLFFRQFGALKDYAQAHGILILGDMPIFVSNDSADVWLRPDLFKLDRHLRPRAIAGTPPDYFCPTGQVWGNPVYDWSAMRRDGYRWWIEHFRAAMQFCDVVRIDHFRGFAAAWEIPAKAKDGSAGKWVRGPGAALFKLLEKSCGGLGCIVEDLGVITDDVSEMRDKLGLMGMRVLQFGFDQVNLHSPQNIPEHALAYTGTHDNDTTQGWWRGLPRAVKKRVRLIAPDVDASAARALIRLAWISPARIAVTPMQDLLSLGSKARMNVPGQAEGNWAWRLRSKDLEGEALPWLADLTKVCGRAYSSTGI